MWIVEHVTDEFIVDTIAVIELSGLQDAVREFLAEFCLVGGVLPQ